LLDKKMMGDDTTRRIASALDTLSLLEAYKSQELHGERFDPPRPSGSRTHPLVGGDVQPVKGGLRNPV
jgi:hypothetical protein